MTLNYKKVLADAARFKPKRIELAVGDQTFVVVFADWQPVNLKEMV